MVEMKICVLCSQSKICTYELHRQWQNDHTVDLEIFMLGIFRVFNFSAYYLLQLAQWQKKFNGVYLKLRAHAREVSRPCKVITYGQFYLSRVCDTAFQMESCVRRYFNMVFIHVCICAYTCSPLRFFTRLIFAN